MSADGWKRFDRSGSWEYDIEMPGFKYNMTDVQAAIGTHQLRKLAGFHARRREIVDKYNQVFGANPGFQVPVERADCISAWHLYALRVRPEVVGVDRNTLIDRLKALNIGTSVHYKPLHMMSFYARKYGYRPEDFPVAYDAYQRVVSLPLHPRLSDADAQDVIDAVHEAVGSEAVA